MNVGPTDVGLRSRLGSECSSNDEDRMGWFDHVIKDDLVEGNLTPDRSKRTWNESQG